MAAKRTNSMEIRVLRDNMLESPPPPPPGTTMREWFTGLAIANPELMKDVPPGERVAEAMRLADELIVALSAPRVPQLDTMRPPSRKEMKEWEKTLKVNKAAVIRKNFDTCPAAPNARRRVPETSDAMLPPPLRPETCTSLPPLPPFKLPMQGGKHLPATSRYSSLQDDVMQPQHKDCDEE